jgi:hypothetical protein
VDASALPRAVAAAVSTASALGLVVHDTVLVRNSNRIAVRLLPCDVLGRVEHMAPRRGGEAGERGEPSAHLEVEVARQLAGTGSPVAGLDPRVEPRLYAQDGFAVSLWAYHEPVSPQSSGDWGVDLAGHPVTVAPRDYARALERLHAGLRQIDVPAPHFTDRVAEAQALVADRARTPGHAGTDREFLSATLRSLGHSISGRGAHEQLLHGEPHPANVLTTKTGPLLIDLETCCRGPIEFDLAHAPPEVAEHYPGADQGLARECRVLVLAMITAWRWDRDDDLPNGQQLGTDWLSQVRSLVDHRGPDLGR